MHVFNWFLKCLRPFLRKRPSESSVIPCWQSVPRFVASSRISLRIIRKIQQPRSRIPSYPLQSFPAAGSLQHEANSATAILRSIVALEKDLETLDAEYNLLSDCMAKGEQNEFNAASLVLYSYTKKANPEKILIHLKSLSWVAFG